MYSEQRVCALLMSRKQFTEAFQSNDQYPPTPDYSKLVEPVHRIKEPIAGSIFRGPGSPNWH